MNEGFEFRSPGSGNLSITEAQIRADEACKIRMKIGEWLEGWKDKLLEKYDYAGYIPTNARSIEVDLDNTIQALKEGREI